MWFTNDPLPAVSSRLGWAISGTGHWMPTLLEGLTRSCDIQVDVATVYPGIPNEHFEENGVKYFLIGQPKVKGFFFKARDKDLMACKELVRERAPDLVHIHGTERFYGLMAARRLTSVPVVISLQGLLKPYLPVFFGALSRKEALSSDRVIELATGRGLLWLYRGYVRGAKQEQEILSRAKWFMGRTDWDRAHVKSANSSASYYHVGEMLRSPFKQAHWNVSQCERHTIIFTNAGNPCRGTEVLLQAMLTIKREFPNVKLRLAGNIGVRRGYDRFLRRTIARTGLSDAVEFLGYLDASAMARELCRAHVFAQSSFLENSPNSLCEAMQVGLPCVASFVGGIPSLIEQGQTGLLYPVGDAPLLADSIMQVFRDDDFASRLSIAARNTASERHAPERVLSELLRAYRDVIERANESGCI